MLQNYAAARTIGIPIRVVPFSPFNPFWSLVDRKVALFLCRLPFVRGNTISRYNWRGWDIEDRWQSHYEMGDVFVLVTPQYNMIQLNSPEAITSVFKRSIDFPRPVWVNDVLGVFGPNISCAEGQSWKAQRKVATRCFNEANNEIVWGETLGLSHDMIHYWSSKPSIKSSADDIRTLTLNVLARAGFGKSFKFRGHEEQRPADEIQSMSYRESLGLILENCIIILALGPKTLAFLARYWLPSKLKTVNRAVVSFQTHIATIYEEQKRAFSAGEEGSDNNLMTLLVRASQEAANEESGGLTESEIYGNMFTFNFAGHDTTAHSSTFVLYFLAANPEVQDWISEEIQRVLGDRQPHEINYRTDFPRFKRCLAVLYETLRLYTIVPAIKWTGDRATTLTVGDKTLNLPAKTIILPSYCSIHMDPRYWGSDSLTWRPSRWIRPSTVATELGDDEMDMNQRGVFLGWSEGTRDCPGKKFSQVEFVALMVGLFRQWRVDPAKKHPGESIEASRRRVLDLIREDSGWVLLLQMLHPERAPLVWYER
ncbi:putative cytochrome p450 monooxygenase protein [Eutypa lata UCREL1]|uniref:Putative cytochrome p450 monooxygenase protein n=1 Tax=Eutypa lata (strain UCR-EL1) TaxID=1287681 RepID=M7T7N2_EUTLA|nr:putative cytochrome p450 monooxygenase protein [Eutypa lata UCREL1]